MRIVRGETVVEKVPPAVVTFDRLLRERVWAIPSTSFVLRRDALVGSLGLVDERLPGSYAEDYDLMLRVAWRRPLVSVEQPLVDVYWHEQSFFAERWATISSALTYLLAKHPSFLSYRRGFARIKGQIAFADAARGHRREAVAAAGVTIKHNPGERRAYLALLVAARVIDAGTIVRIANERGRGI